MEVLEHRQLVLGHSKFWWALCDDQFKVLSPGDTAIYAAFLAIMQVVSIYGVYKFLNTNCIQK